MLPSLTGFLVQSILMQGGVLSMAKTAEMSRAADSPTEKLLTEEHCRTLEEVAEISHCCSCTLQNSLYILFQCEAVVYDFDERFPGISCLAAPSLVKCDDILTKHNIEFVSHSCTVFHIMIDIR